MSSRRSPGRANWSSSPPPGPGRSCPQPPQPGAGSWDCSPARPPATRRAHAWTGTSDPAARPLAQARAGGPALLLEAGCPEAGRAALAITGRGGPGTSVLYAACERVLRPGGVLAVITASTPRPGGLRDDPGEVIAAARAAGLVYAQHIVALHATITGGQLTTGPPDAARPDEAAGPPAVCARIHSDLLVFTKPGGTPR